ncbi:hypothetical protein N2603_40365 [Bradyrhizobium huanghuaihaiense]|uniref:hypothetical protein n=1 Tax=Bradyrhizobium huanghuaihaiense TaxID=990078 RepID=UPI0021AAC595|nr:hypothetical protein [Bradyrhizobium sp. CB3035]UWU76103.1 hypothetical protein N2603_40365 [Bradyrhizobium sp. CB3035]
MTLSLETVEAAKGHASRRSATSCVNAARFVRDPIFRVKEFGTMGLREAQRFGSTGQDTVAGMVIVATVTYHRFDSLKRPTAIDGAQLPEPAQQLRH